MRWISLFVFSGMAATCGQTGPLTLPDESALIEISPGNSARTHLVGARTRLSGQSSRTVGEISDPGERAT